MEKKKLSLPKQIGIALLLGILAGYAFYMLGIPEFTTNYLKPFGTIFVNLLKFIVVPVVLLSMIDGIISMGDMKKVGSVGWKTVAYFLVTTAAACVIGLVFANLFNNAGWFPTLALEDGAVWDKATSANFMDTLVAIFPSNMWKSFTDANMLQVIVIALMFGGGILAAGEKGKLAKDLVSTLYAVIERVMAFIIALSPIGVFTMMAWVVATQGPEILGSLAVVLGCAYLGYIVHAVLCYSFSAKAFAGISPFTFFEKASPAMIFAFTSTSSAATIPLSKECADELGAEGDVSSFVIPLGATINMDGTAIYQCVATIFLATCCGMTLTLGQMVTIVVTATLASIGNRRYAGRGHDHARHGARGDEHPRRYDHDHLRHRPSFRHGPYLPEHHGRYLLRLLRDQVGEQEGRADCQVIFCSAIKMPPRFGAAFFVRTKRIGIAF